MTEFPKVRNPLEGVTITRPPKYEPVIRGAGNQADEEAGREIMAVTETPAAGVTKIH